MVNVEIKTLPLPGMYSGLAEAVVGLIVSMQMEDLVLISSFDHTQLVTARARSDAVALGVLTSGRIARPGDYLRLLDADTYLPSTAGEDDSLGFGSVSGGLDYSSTRQVRAVGGQVMVWTCNDPNQIRPLIALGVTGIISDYPNRVRRVLDDEGGGDPSARGRGASPS